MHPGIHYPFLSPTNLPISEAPGTDSRPLGMKCLQNDDRVNLGNDSFMAMEAELAKRYDHEPQYAESDSLPTALNGTHIRLAADTFELSQPEHAK